MSAKMKHKVSKNRSGKLEIGKPFVLGFTWMLL